MVLALGSWSTGNYQPDWLPDQLIGAESGHRAECGVGDADAERRVVDDQLTERPTLKHGLVGPKALDGVRFSFNRGWIRSWLTRGSRDARTAARHRVKLAPPKALLMPPPLRRCTQVA
jgi:hypothetical protein